MPKEERQIKEITDNDLDTGRDLVTENYELEILTLKDKVDLRKFSRAFLKLDRLLKNMFSNKLDKGEYIGDAQDLKNEIDGKVQLFASVPFLGLHRAGDNLHWYLDAERYKSFWDTGNFNPSSKVDKAGDTMTNTLKISGVTTPVIFNATESEAPHIRSQINGVNDWYVGRDIAENRSVSLYSYSLGKGIHIQEPYIYFDDVISMASGKGITLRGDGKVITANNYGVYGFHTDGGAAPLIFKDTSNKVHLGWNKEYEIIADGDLKILGTPQIERNYPFIYFKDTRDGADQSRHYVGIGSDLNKFQIVNAHTGKELALNSNGKLTYDGNEVLDNKNYCPHRIGDILETTNTEHPAASWTGTGWERYGNGRVIVGLNEGESEFNSIGKIGGAKEVALRADQTAPHNHTLTSVVGGGGWYGQGGGLGGLGGITTSTSGSGTPHSNLQPYIVAYRWRRIS